MRPFLPEVLKGFYLRFSGTDIHPILLDERALGFGYFDRLILGFANEVTGFGEATLNYDLNGAWARICRHFFAVADGVYLSMGHLPCPWIPYGKTHGNQSVLFVNCVCHSLRAAFCDGSFFRYFEYTRFFNL